MKIRRKIPIATFVLALALATGWVLISRQQSSQSYKSLTKLWEATQGYSRDLVSHGQSLPSSVTLQDLIEHGYISAGEVRDLNRAEVTFYPAAENSSDPQAILIRVRMTDHIDTVVLADGSIQQMTR